MIRDEWFPLMRSLLHEREMASPSIYPFTDGNFNIFLGSVGDIAEFSGGHREYFTAVKRRRRRGARKLNVESRRGSRPFKGEALPARWYNRS